MFGRRQTSGVPKLSWLQRAARARSGRSLACWLWLCLFAIGCTGRAAEQLSPIASPPAAAAGVAAGATPGSHVLDAGPTAGRTASAAPVPSAGATAQAGHQSLTTTQAAGGGASAADSGGSKSTMLPDAAVQDAMAPHGAAGPSAPICPSTPSLKAGDSSAMLEHGGRSRHYLVHVPSSLKANTAVPLVLDFHGNGSSASQESSGSGWAKKADTEGFITAYPDGVGGGWNVGNCCGEALSSKVDDVGFAKAIVAAISSAACIDPKRVYATGISNGAGLSHRLACEAADVFAAIAAASADLVTDPCKPARPISELSVRGLSDTLVAYAGGNTGSTGWYSPGAKGTLALWKDIDHCDGMPETTHQYCETYKHCAAGVEITLCSLPNTGHILYNNALGFSVPDVAWELFMRQPLP